LSAAIIGDRPKELGYRLAQERLKTEQPGESAQTTGETGSDQYSIDIWPAKRNDARNLRASQYSQGGRNGQAVLIS